MARSGGWALKSADTQPLLPRPYGVGEQNGSSSASSPVRGSLHDTRSGSPGSDR